MMSETIGDRVKRQGKGTDKNKLKKAIKRLEHPYLNINRLPRDTYEEFRKYAHKEWCGDYGMAFKHIWEVFKGLDARVSYIEQALITALGIEEEKGIKTLGRKGKKLKR